MQALLHDFGHGAAAIFVGSLALVAGIIGGPRAFLMSPPQTAGMGPVAAQTAIIGAIGQSLSVLSAGVASTTTSTAATIIANLLPKVILKKIAVAAKKISVTNAATASTTTSVVTPPPAPAPALQNITAQSLLADATTTFSPRLGGSFAMIFNAVSQGKTFLTWSYGDTPIGGTDGIPQFDAEYSCNPPPDQGLLFGVRSSYDCTVSVTPLSGSDRRVQSKDFSVETGAGEFFASVPSSMSTILTNDQNDGGFVFKNEDTEPVTVKDLTLDIFYQGLNTAYGPLVLRLLNPTDNTDYTDYHMESFPEDPTAQFTHHKEGIAIPLPFTFIVPGSNQKMLPIQVLGVQKMSVVGVDPTVTITLRGIATDRTDIKTQVNAPQISWSCVVILGEYDPMATSGPYAMGTACKN